MMKQLWNYRHALWIFLIVADSIFIYKSIDTNAAVMNTSLNIMSVENATALEENTANTQVVSTVQLDVPLIQQLPELARGCEVTSLAMILLYSGIHVDKMKLAENIAYEPFQINGKMGNMNKGFVGNMETFKKSGLGVYVEPIIELAQQYVEMHRIINITGQPTDELYRAIDAGFPVWILTNSRFSHLPKEQFRTWQTDEGPMKVTYRQHSVVLTYYDNEYVYINDPLKSKRNIAIDRTNFEMAWVQMGRQAFYIIN